MNKLDYVRIGRAVERHYPEVFDEVLSASQEAIQNTDLIAGMYAHYVENYKTNRWSHKRLFVAAILQLYCPETLHFGLIVKNKICSILAEVVGFKERQSISNLIPDIRANLKIPPFRLQVEELCEDLLNRI